MVSLFWHITYLQFDQVADAVVVAVVVVGDYYYYCYYYYIY